MRLTPAASLARRVVAGVTLLAVALLSGCVYVRLLQLKGQLGEFDRYFKVDTSRGLSINCLKPVLTTDDVQWLGIVPETSYRHEGREQWSARWVKDRPPCPPETTVYDVELSAEFVDDHLQRVSIPDKYFEFFPKNHFLNLLKSAGRAKVDKTQRSASAEASLSQPDLVQSVPKISAISGMLGAPTSQSTAHGNIEYRYRYSPKSASKSGRPIEVTFSFDPTSGRLNHMFCKLPRGSIQFNLTEAPPAGHVPEGELKPN